MTPTDTLCIFFFLLNWLKPFFLFELKEDYVQIKVKTYCPFLCTFKFDPLPNSSAFCHLIEGKIAAGGNRTHNRESYQTLC